MMLSPSIYLAKQPGICVSYLTLVFTDDFTYDAAGITVAEACAHISFLPFVVSVLPSKLYFHKPNPPRTLAKSGLDSLNSFVHCGFATPSKNTFKYQVSLKVVQLG